MGWEGQKCWIFMILHVYANRSVDCMHFRASSPRRYYRGWSPLKAFCVLCKVDKTAMFITTNNGCCCSAEFLLNDFSMQTLALTQLQSAIACEKWPFCARLLHTAIKEHRCNKSSIDWADLWEGQHKILSYPSHTLYTELQLVLWQKSLGACNTAINTYFRRCVKTLSQRP